MSGAILPVDGAFTVTKTEGGSPIRVLRWRSCGVLHVGLTVADADRSIAFYCDNFGFELLTERVAERGWVEQVTGVPDLRLRIVHLHGHGWNLELLEYQNPRGASRARGFNDAGSAHLCFVTETSTASSRG